MVSIIIPVYNGSNYMREAIDSALTQTYKNIEILVINDGSDDDGETERIALSYGDKIRYISKTNGGVSSALNVGIRCMRGEYFSWLSHDDTYTPNKVKMQIERLNNCFDETIVFCQRDYMDSESKVFKKNKEIFPNDKLTSIEALLYTIRHIPNGCALLIPKSAFEKVGLFDENLRYCQDIFMWWKIFLAGYSLVFCNEVGVSSRVHANQLTQTGSALYHHDAHYIGQRISEDFARFSTQDNNVLFAYAMEEAKHNNPGVVSLCLELGKKYGVFTENQILKVRCFQIYGKIRPFIRKAYYLIFRGIKT